MVEHVEQGLGDVPVQMSKKVVEKPKKKRSIEDKVGRQKYHEVVTKKILGQNEQILEELRWVRHKLDRLGEADYSKSDAEYFAFQDEVDREIVQRFLEVGVDGALPKDVAAEVNKRGGYSLKYYDVSRRIVRMNKRLHFETGKVLFEKRGHRWALTRFAFEVYGESESDISSSASETVGSEVEKA
ncbi:MAG: hypothetical protein ABSB10_00630 [Candidatus Bathyarchaeia archaeon]